MNNSQTSEMRKPLSECLHSRVPQVHVIDNIYVNLMNLVLCMFIERCYTAYFSQGLFARNFWGSFKLFEE